MEYKIPLFDLNFGQEEEDAILKTLRSKWISMGPNVAHLEEIYAARLKVSKAIAVTNCTAALHMALYILGIKDGDEVIVPSLTFVATVNSVRYCNATPVFADVKSYDDFTICPVDIKAKITSKTKAILVMHYGGYSCDMDVIMDLAKKYNLYVIEDAAHAPDSSYKGKKLGTIGDIGCFSFFSNKNITCAEGGMLVTNSHELAEKAKLIRGHGMTSMSFERAKGHSTEYDVKLLGFNYRMDDIRGALMIAQLEKLDADLEKRKELAEHYFEQLDEIEGIIIPFKNFNYKSSYYIMPILLKNSTIAKRDSVRIQLAKAGIQTSIHYPAAHRFSIYNENKQKLPKTEYITDNEITLPLYFSLSVGEINCIVKTLKNILSNEA